YEVCKRLKAEPQTHNIPVIFVTAMGETEDEKHGFDLGAVDYITKPVSPFIVEARVRTHISLYDQARLLENTVKERTAELLKTRLEIIQRLGVAGEFKDNETGFHVIRMSHFTSLIAKGAGYSDDAVELLFNASTLHDVGKIGIPDKILLKPGKLDAEEWLIMQSHSLMGHKIIGSNTSELLTLARSVAKNHHEKWNGSGYPEGLSGEDIPHSCRITTIADVFDALTSSRPYKKPWSIEKTMEYFIHESGKQFDPGLISILKEQLPEFIKIKNAYQ
ncbi:MAG: HD domain-containing protein, partial [Candidatus Marinimicrobia bacterium]|nr:HD domain-containing protein [Candidatus Neomarinimicrobiota bacterium]